MKNAKKKANQSKDLTFFQQKNPNSLKVAIATICQKLKKSFKTVKRQNEIDNLID